MTTLNANVGSPGTIGSASGGRTYAFTLGTTPIQIVGANPQRQKITIHNPGTVDIFVAPLYVISADSDLLLVPSPTALAGCFRVFANGGTFVIDGECQKPYQAFAASGSNNPLTVVTTSV